MTDPACTFFKLGVALIATIALSAPVFAQEKKDAYTLEAVKVSAQKREENVQEVPQSIEVLSDLSLEENRITEFSEIQHVVPNLHTASTGGSGTYSFLSIRGRSNCTQDVDPTVSVFVDGVPYDDLYAVANNPLFDIERIEVLRGPQSTLYGLNSEAGVINIITKQPSETLITKAFGEGSYGDKYDGSYRVGGTISGPLIPNKLKGSLALTTKYDGGYVLNRATDEPFNSSQTTGTRGNFVFTPTEDWNISGGLSYTNLSGDSGYIMVPYDKGAAAALGQSFSEWETDVDEEGYSDLETIGANLKVNYQFDATEITSISAYRHSDQKFGYDSDFTPAALAIGEAKNEFSTITQEMRFQSSRGEESPLQWLTGYFFHKFEREQQMGFNKVVYYDGTTSGTSHAVFGQGTYRFLNRRLGLTLGLRQEWTERETDLETGYYSGASVSDSMLLPKAAIDYRLTPEAMLYASVSRGWRSGGVNLFAVSTDLAKFDKETCWAYEVGAKTQWFNNRLKLNVAAFYTDYEDYQDAVRLTFMTQYLNNVPRVRMMGFETELQAQLSDSLNLTGGFGYADTEYVDAPDPVVGDFNGNSVAMVPDFDAHLALRYSFLENYYIRPEVRGVGTIYWDPDNSKKQDPYMTFNLRTGYTGDNYEIYVYGQNLTNEYAFTYALDYNRNDNYYGNPITPMCFGLGASIQF